MKRYIKNSYWDVEQDRDNRMYVCEHCLMGIEAHEGPQHARVIWVDEEDPEESYCDWCEESGFDQLYEI